VTTTGLENGAPKSAIGAPRGAFSAAAQCAPPSRETRTPAELATWAVEAAPRGEMVVLVGPPLPQAVTDEAIAAKLTPMLSVMSLSDAAKTAADDLGVAKARVYDIGIALKRRSEG